VSCDRLVRQIAQDWPRDSRQLAGARSGLSRFCCPSTMLRATLSPSRGCGDRPPAL